MNLPQLYVGIMMLTNPNEELSIEVIGLNDYEYSEYPGVFAGAFLEEEGAGALVGEVEPDGDGAQRNGQHEQRAAAGRNVDGPLEYGLIQIHWIRS